LATREELRYKCPPFKKEFEAALRTDKYCRFYESHRYDTNECRHLCDLIEEYIQRRKLEQYIQRDPKPSPPKDGWLGLNVNRSNKEKITVHTISREPHIADKSWVEMECYKRSLRNEEGYVHSFIEGRSSKRKEKQDIVFNANELESRQYPHIDPMVISACFGPAEVFRILVDTGSSVNILFKHAFNKMRLFIKYVIPCNKPLHGFTGDAKMSLG